MTEVESLAEFASRASYDEISPEGRAALRARVLDSLGCALGALPSEPIRAIRRYCELVGGNPHATLILGGRSAPDRAAFYNSALVRYLDFNDSYLAAGETCHPSDNLGAVLAAAEHRGASGRELLSALAVAYQVQCRLSDEAPLRQRGFDHVTQGAYAAAAGVSRALGLHPSRAAQAIAISGTAFNALRVTRTGSLSNWKGLAYPNVAFGATHAALLASEGITGPAEVFEGKKGFKESVAGPFSLDWSRERLDRVERTILKRYNAEIHSQSVIEGVLELRTRGEVAGAAVERVELEVFDVAHLIIGGGAEGDKHLVRTKEEADHSLPYLVAVALLDGEVGPAQYAPARITASDVQALLRRVRVRPSPELSQRFPAEMPARIRIALRDGRELELEKKDYLGFNTRPMPWPRVAEKFRTLAEGAIPVARAEEIVAAVESLDSIEVRELTELLGAPGGEG